MSGLFVPDFGLYKLRQSVGSDEETPGMTSLLTEGGNLKSMNHYRLIAFILQIIMESSMESFKREGGIQQEFHDYSGF